MCGACLTTRGGDQVGFHGVDVDVMVRDLVDVAIAQVKQRKRKEVQKAVDEAVENTILTALMGKDVGDRSTWKTLLRSGQLDNQKIEIDVCTSSNLDACVYCTATPTCCTATRACPPILNGRFVQVPENAGKSQTAGKRMDNFQEIVFQISNANGKPRTTKQKMSSEQFSHAAPRMAS